MAGSDQKAKDRRRTPRIRASHDVVIRTGGDKGFRARLVDLNLGGIYCTLDRHLPLFTKLGVGLSLPIQLHDGVYPCDIEVEGVVVRMEPEDPEPGRIEYACALAFVNIGADVELVVAKYILQSLVAED